MLPDRQDTNYIWDKNFPLAYNILNNKMQTRIPRIYKRSQVYDEKYGKQEMLLGRNISHLNKCVQPLFVLSSLSLLGHFSRVRLCAAPEMAAFQAPPTLGLSRQEHWTGLPFPSPMHESESESEVAQSCPTI